MKTVILAICTIIFSSTAFAADCYKAQSVVPFFVPESFCVESLNVDVINNLDETYLTGSSIPGLNTLKTTELIRVNEDQFSFIAKGLINKEWDYGCGMGQWAELELSGRTDFNGFGNTSELTVKVNAEQTNDNCHSHTYTYTISYKLVK
ncbi:MAG: hypothetical protein K2Q18_05440 [Bdellovibrionales bacterium]|nr:hypothetical protein [Bdellovibrionales bacterium]